MLGLRPGLALVAFLTACFPTAALQTQAPPPPQTSKQQNPKTLAGTQGKKPPDAEAELQKAVDDASNDQAALVRNLEDYLRRFPDAPRKVAIYRAIVEAAQQLRDSGRALDYAERIIALRPEDSQMMLLAIDLLEKTGDAHSLDKAIGYASRVLDMLEKATPEGKPSRLSAGEWEATQKKARMSLRLTRARLEMARHDYDAAAADLEVSYRLVANPGAAMRLGEIAELHKDYKKAIDEYVLAFVLPDAEDSSINRWDVRKKLGNLWQMVNGSEAGLGERILQAYDRLNSETKPAGAASANKGLTDPYAFVLRRLNGSAPLKLVDWKGKVLVLNFWATWCGPCRDLEPIFEQIGRKYENRGSGIGFFAVNTDEDENRVAPYVAKERMRSTVAFADGLDDLLEIKGIPTVIVFNRAGKIVYRAEGFDEEGFAAAVSAAIEKALGGKP